MVSTTSSKQIPPTAPPIIADRLESSEPGIVGGQGESVVDVNKADGLHLQQSTCLFITPFIDIGKVLPILGEGHPVSLIAVRSEQKKFLHYRKCNSSMHYTLSTTYTWCYNCNRT